MQCNKTSLHRILSTHLVGRYLAALRIDFELCLRMPWGAKEKSTEMGLPEVSAHLCCTIPLFHTCIQNLESNPAIVPATTLAETVMESTPDEVRWPFHDLRFL